MSAAGEGKREVQAAVTFAADHGMKPQSEILSVTVTSADPGKGTVPGSPIEFVNRRLGIMVPEVGDKGRVPGGKPYYQASGIRVTHSQRKAADAA